MIYQSKHLLVSTFDVRSSSLKHDHHLFYTSHIKLHNKHYNIATVFLNVLDINQISLVFMLFKPSDASNSALKNDNLNHNLNKNVLIQ